MENNNNQPAPVTDNGTTVSQDSIITEDSSKEAPSAPNNGDDNLSPISDSELEEEATTNDTTDARPLSPVPEAEPITQSNDAVEKEPEVPNDNAVTVEVDPPSLGEDTNTGDVEMRDAEEEEAPKESSGVAENEEGQENPSNVPPANAEDSSTTPDEPMDIDETDKGNDVNVAEKDDTVEEDKTTVQTEDTNPNEAAHFESVHEHDESSMANDTSTTAALGEVDIFNDSSANPEPTSEAVTDGAEQEPSELPQESDDVVPTEAPQEHDEKDVQDIEFGSFKDVSVATDEVLTRAAFDTILKETQKNISEFISVFCVANPLTQELYFQSSKRLSRPPKFLVLLVELQ